MLTVFRGLSALIVAAKSNKESQKHCIALDFENITDNIDRKSETKSPVYFLWSTVISESIE